MNETDDLEAVLGVQFKGVQDAMRYADAMKKVASAEKQATQAIRARQQAQAQGQGATSLPTVQQALEAMHGGGTSGGGQKVAFASAGPNARLASIQAEIAKIRPGVTSPDVVEDLFHRRKQAEKAVARMRGGGAPSVGGDVGNVLGGVAAKLSGPIAAATAALQVVKMAGEAMYAMSESAAKASLALKSIQATGGGSGLDAARIQGLGFIGASAQAAAAFHERITTDSYAMMEAGRLGIHQLKGNFGSTNFNADYASAIDKASRIEDESTRLRTSRTLGIEQEVEQYRLLSDATKRQLQASAALTSQLNDLGAQRSGAEFVAAQAREAQARAMASDATARGWERDITGINKLLARVEEAYAGGSPGQQAGKRHGLDFLIQSLPIVGPAYANFKTGAAAAGFIDEHLNKREERVSQEITSPETRSRIAMVESNKRLEWALSMLAGSILGAGPRGNAALNGIRNVGMDYREALLSRSIAYGSLG